MKLHWLSKAKISLFILSCVIFSWSSFAQSSRTEKEKELIVDSKNYILDSIGKRLTGEEAESQLLQFKGLNIFIPQYGIVKVFAAEEWLNDFSSKLFFNKTEVESFIIADKFGTKCLLVAESGPMLDVVLGIKQDGRLGIVFNIIKSGICQSALYVNKCKCIFFPFGGKLDISKINFTMMRCPIQKIWDPMLGKLTGISLGQLPDTVQKKINDWLFSNLVFLTEAKGEVYVGFDNLATIDRGITVTSSEKIIHFLINETCYNTKDLKMLEQGDIVCFYLNGYWPRITIVEKMNDTGVIKISSAIEVKDNNGNVSKTYLTTNDELLVNNPEKGYSTITWKFQEDSSYAIKEN